MFVQQRKDGFFMLLNLMLHKQWQEVTSAKNVRYRIFGHPCWTTHVCMYMKNTRIDLIYNSFS